jgi:D-alanyl-D-alanine dipeptidase
LVDIRTLVPDLSLQIHYAGSENFLGVPVEGYGAARCYLSQPAAQALQRVEQSLRQDGLRLRVFDCYRPARAVRHFVRWAADVTDQRSKSRYYPNLEKTQLLGDYIAPVSGHSRGATLDLTLLDCRRSDGECVPVDMGTEFDFFDPSANTDSPQVTQSQRDNRQRLLRAMAQEGFRNYPMEWWHFTLASHDSPAIHDIAIE